MRKTEINSAIGNAKAKRRELDEEIAVLNSELAALNSELGDITLRERLPDCFHKLVDDGILKKVDVSERWNEFEYGGITYINVDIGTNVTAICFQFTSMIRDLSEAYNDQAWDEDLCPPFGSNYVNPATLQQAWKYMLDHWKTNNEEELGSCSDHGIFCEIMYNLVLYCHCIHGGTIRDVFPDATLDGIEVPSKINP